MNANVCPGPLTTPSQRHAADTNAPSTIMRGLRRGLILATVIWVAVAYSFALLR